MVDKHKTFVCFMKHTMLMCVLFVHAITLNAHEPEEFWWHTNAMDVEYVYHLNVDSVVLALDTMTNQDSIFHARLDIINHYFVLGELEESMSLLYNLSVYANSNYSKFSNNTGFGLSLLYSERLLSANWNSFDDAVYWYRANYIKHEDHPISIAIQYHWLRIYMKTSGDIFETYRDEIETCYYSAIRLQYWEPLGELANWMHRMGKISDQEFVELYNQLPPRPKTYALIYLGSIIKKDDPIWMYREMVRLGGSTNMFGTFRGNLELANYFLTNGKLDSCGIHLERARNSGKFLQDLDIAAHINTISIEYYKQKGDTLKMQEALSERRRLDTLLHIPKTQVRNFLVQDLSIQLEASKQLLEWQVNILRWFLISLGVLVFVIIIQTIRVTRQRKQLRRANDDKAMLYGMIAHDLRSPLAALDSVIQQEGIPPIAQASIHNYARKLQFLLDDMLKWTFDQRQQLKPQPTTFDLVELVEENHQLLAQVLADKSITVQWHMEEEVVMYADREMISTCVRNMLQNAVKHSVVGSQITVRCREEDGKAVLEIENEGSLSQRGGRSLGLQLIQSFSRLNNCRFSIQEQEGRVVARLNGPNQ